jgi:rhodanese-related sulfurtransferase
MTKRFFLIALLVIVALSAAACGSSQENTKQSEPTDQPATFQTVSVEDAHQKLNGDNGAIIVDVREPQEWTATGHPPDARLIPLGQFAQRAPNELPKDTDIYVICNSGNRSQVASQSLIDLGYTQVFNVDGGIQAWLQAGLPTEAYTP